MRGVGAGVVALLVVACAGEPRPVLGETRCHPGGPVSGAWATLPPVYGVDGEQVVCNTELNGAFAYSEDACLPERLEAAGWEAVSGWGHGVVCGDEYRDFVPAPVGEQWDSVRCWEPSPTATGDCWGLLGDRWFHLMFTCDADQSFIEGDGLPMAEVCPGFEPAVAPEDLRCSEWATLDGETVKRCYQRVGDTLVFMKTPCSMASWPDPVPTEPCSD